MPMTARELVKLLKKNGFREVGQRGSHLKLKNKRNNKIVIVPIHSDDLPKGTEQAILKEAGLK